MDYYEKRDRIDTLEYDDVKTTGQIQAYASQISNDVLFYIKQKVNDRND